MTQVGLWKVVGTPYRIGKNWKVLCICKCGTKKEVWLAQVNKTSKSCGCTRLKKEYRKSISERRTTHGMSKTLIYGLWSKMIDRCINKNHKQYKDYGGRGIRVCKRWLKFENFYTDMGDRPNGLTLDRKNNDGDYSPSNCKWSTRKEQRINSRNRIDTVYLTLGGVTLSISEWSKKLGIPYSRLKNRYRAGWSVEKVLSENKFHKHRS